MTVGRVERPHGLSGEVAVTSLTDFPARFEPGSDLYAVDGTGRPRALRVAAVRPHRARLLVRFEGLEDLASAESLRGSDLRIPPGDGPERPPNFFFEWELAGLEVVGRDGRPLGRVTGLENVAGRHLLALETPAGPREVPFVEPIVVSIEPSAGRVVLDPPEGLLD